MNSRACFVIALVEGSSSLSHRQSLFLESMDKAEKEGGELIAAIEKEWLQSGLQITYLTRDARDLGDKTQNPFLKDLFELGLSVADAHDWLLYRKVDCAIAPDLFQQLRNARGTVVEYMRQDVDNAPQRWNEIFSYPREALLSGLDAIATRADFSQKISPFLPDVVVGEPYWYFVLLDC